MKKLLTVDSSLIVASLLKEDANHLEAKKVWKDVTDGDVDAVEPLTVLVEVAGAIRRRTRSEPIAMKAVENLLAMDNVVFALVDHAVAKSAAVISIATGLRGMDAFVVEAAKRFDADLRTLDMEMERLARKVLER
jgi:predicted nucleic acid-binding protein